MSDPITINSALDAAALGREYSGAGRIHVKDFLVPADAERLYGAIRSNTEWYLAYTENGQAVESPSADVMASCYGPGHYLTAHDDTHHKRDWAAAYVIRLTKDWNRNWGGHLAFFDPNDNIERAIMPTFNALNVFSVPQFHAVQMVAPVARAVQTSFTGWVHT